MASLTDVCTRVEKYLVLFGLPMANFRLGWGLGLDIQPSMGVAMRNEEPSTPIGWVSLDQAGLWLF